jgi:hypothetical protein
MLRVYFKDILDADKGRVPRHAQQWPIPHKFISINKMNLIKYNTYYLDFQPLAPALYSNRVEVSIGLTDRGTLQKGPNGVNHWRPRRLGVGTGRRAGEDVHLPNCVVRGRLRHRGVRGGSEIGSHD